MVIIAHERGNCSAYNAGWQSAILHFPNFKHLLVIDDDELADPLWLETMCKAAERLGADIVGGPQVPVFADPSHAIWAEHPVFAPPYRETGRVPALYSSGNLLLGRNVLTAMGPPFLDLRFNFMGGGDSDFLSRAAGKGFVLGWCAEARVHETVPARRVEADWIRARSLRNGVISTLVSLIIGIAVGATAGYLGGRVDEAIMRFVDVLYSIPYMMVVIVLLAFFGGRSPISQLFLLFLALGAVSWLTMARIVRGQVMSLKSQEFILAARATGVPAARIILRHLVPNTLGPVIVYATLTIPSVMLLESFLSFLGLGVQAPLASWGSLAADGIQNLAVFPWQLICPGLTMAATLFALNFLGDGLRDALDPQMRKG